METQRLLIVLTGVNLGLLGYQLVQPHSGVAATVDVPAVIRGRALEIVDDRGMVRASLSVLPERSEEHTSELQSQSNIGCRLLLEKKKKNKRSCMLLCHLLWNNST